MERQYTPALANAQSRIYANVREMSTSALAMLQSLSKRVDDGVMSGARRVEDASGLKIHEALVGTKDHGAAVVTAVKSAANIEADEKTA